MLSLPVLGEKFQFPPPKGLKKALSDTKYSVFHCSTV